VVFSYLLLCLTVIFSVLNDFVTFVFIFVNKKLNVKTKCKNFNSLLHTQAEKTLKIIGSAETRTSILHPARGMIRYAIRISNDENIAHTTCIGKETQIIISAKEY